MALRASLTAPAGAALTAPIGTAITATSRIPRNNSGGLEKYKI